MAKKDLTIVDERWNKAALALRRDTRNYWTNLSYFVGEQWVTWSATENAIRRIEPNPKRARVVRNRIKRSVRINLAKLIKNPLYFDVAPSSADDAAVKGAQLAQTALDDVKDRQNWENVRRSEVLSTMLGGTAGVSLEWDPAGFKIRGMTDSGRPFGEGDVCLTPLSILGFVAEPGVIDAELGRWWIKETAETPEDAQEKFGLTEKPEPDATTATSAFEQRILATGSSMSGATRSYDGRVIVKTMFERPTKTNPRGRICTSIGGKIVQDVAWYFPFRDRLNLFVFRDMPVDQRWTGESMVTDAIGPQTELNLARSVISEHLKKAGSARLWVPDPSIDEEDLTDDPGQPVFYNPVGGQKPEWSTPPGLPAWEVQYPEQAATEIDDILGVHDVSRGMAPTGVDAGVALSILAERDDTPLGLIARDQAEGWGRIATAVLACYEQRVKQPRTLTVRPAATIGQPAAKPYDVQFSGDMLHGQTRATVPLEVMVPRSRAAQQAWASSLLQMGALGTPPDMRLFARLADLPNKDMFLAALSADADRAQRENEKMFRGQVAEPRDFDNHSVHLAEVNAARKSDRYERSSPEVQQLFDLHAKAHEVMAAEEAAQQEMKATESPGLAAAASATEAPGSVMPAAAADQLAAQRQQVPSAPVAPVDVNAMAAMNSVDQRLGASPAGTFGEAGTP